MRSLRGVTTESALEQGPIEAEVTRLLREMGCPGAVRSMPRSPVGPGALRVLAANRPEAMASRLEEEPWVAAVALRPPNLYLQVKTERLIGWVCAAFDTTSGFDEDGVGPRKRDPIADEASLASARSSFVNFALERIVASPSIASASVGEIEVRYGPLRMRNGGGVRLVELREEIGSAYVGRWKRQPGSEEVESVLAMAMLSTPRSKHVRIDEEWVERNVEDSGRLIALRALDATNSDGRDEEGEKALALALDASLRGPARVAEMEDPVFLARPLMQIGRCMWESRLPAAKPLRIAAVKAVSLGLARLVGLSEPLRVNAR